MDQWLKEPEETPKIVSLGRGQLPMERSVVADLHISNKPALKFLTAEWRKLAMVNYAVQPDYLRRYVPHGTELDIWNGICYMSLVGFMFLDTKLLGIPIPFHRNFEEVNLRFYVKHRSAQGWRRGVVFIKEIVPRRALSFVANRVYGENYITQRIAHRIGISDDSIEVEYGWENGDLWNRFKVKATNERVDIAEGSEEEFITEHYWGYTWLDPSRTSEYQVEHPRWEVYPTLDYQVDVDFGAVYGHEFRFLNSTDPTSAFLAEGSGITVRRGSMIKPD